MDLFEDAWKICLSGPDVIVWVAHLLPISSQNITESKLIPSSIKWVERVKQVQISQDTTQDSKRKCWNIN